MTTNPFVRGVLVLSVAALAACSGTRRDSAEPQPGIEPAPAAAGSHENENEVAGAQDGRQEPQDPGAARRAFIIRRSLEEARRSLQLRLWKDAARVAAEVLELDPANKEARDILLTAQEMLGEARPTVERSFLDKIRQVEVARQKDRFRARELIKVGDAHMAASRYGDAIESYERALLTLRYSIHFAPGSELEKEIEAKLRAARQAKAKAEKAEEEARVAKSKAELEAEERKLRLQRATRVKRLLEEANFDFQVGNYDRAVKNLEQALAYEPGNPHAVQLRDLAARARHDFRLDLLRQDWKREWTKTFDELRASDVPQTETIKFDLERWREVSQRQPITFTPPEDLETPEERAIVEKLKNTKLEHRFVEADVKAWAAHYQTVTEVNFVVTPEVLNELDSEVTTLRDFHLPPMSVYKALEVIGSVTGVRWKVENGVVKLVTPAKAGGKMYLVQYEVRDLVQGVANKPGRELKLRAPGDEDAGIGPGEEEEPRPTVVDSSKLVDLIRQNIDPESWDAGKANINEQRGVLLVRHTKEVHEKIRKLLSDLRRAVGIQVDVETRFLKVADSFLEDVGVDFRGLGNQASEGVPGRGLEKHGPRPNAGFDDFGRRELINPATPGSIGTGTEPGIFYDDGLDGDLMARTEHLFDQTLGGQDRLQPSGGLSLQYAFLDDTELEVVLRAVAKQERSEEITAPRLLVYNNSRANMSVLRHTSYIRDFEVEIAQAASVANPVVDVVKDGVVLDVRPVVSADRKFITMELRPTVMTLELPIPTFVTTLGVGQPVSIQLPRVTLQRVRTTVTMPDGGTLMLGGMKLAEKQYQVSGVPILKDLPGLSLLFSRKGQFVENKKILILIRAKIVISEEHEPKLLPDEYETLLLSGSK